MQTSTGMWFRLSKPIERSLNNTVTAYLMREYAGEGYKYGKSIRGFKKWRKREYGKKNHSRSNGG